MSGFIGGLNRDISDIVELHNYISMENLVHQFIKVEQQLKWRGQARRNSTSYFNFSSWKERKKKEGTSSSKETVNDPKGKNINSSQGVSTNKIVKCFKSQSQRHISFQCPTKRTMLIEGKENLEDEEYDGYVGEEYEDGDGEISSGDFLMIRRMLANQTMEEESNQRKKTSHNMYSARKCMFSTY